MVFSHAAVTLGQQAVMTVTITTTAAANVDHLYASTGISRGRLGVGHLLISSGSCHEELRSTTFYAPPHDIRHRQPVGG